MPAGKPPPAPAPAQAGGGDPVTAALPHCPVCGGPLPQGNVAAALAAIRASSYRFRMVKRLARSFGEWVPTLDLAAFIWAEDPDGGPLSAPKAIGVMAYQLRAELAPFGLTIRGHQGGGRGSVGGGSFRLQRLAP